MDNRTTMLDVAADIKKGRMCIRNVSQLAILIGRQDFLKDSTLVGLEWLVHAVRERNPQVHIQFTGPILHGTNQGCIIADLVAEQSEVQWRVDRWAKVSFSAGGRVLCDKNGVIPQLLSEHGLSVKGHAELWKLIYDF